MKPVCYCKKPGIYLLAFCLSVLALPQSVQAQVVSVSGTVTDAQGDPVVGVNVYDSQRTNIGTSTDNSGRYTLKNVSPGATLTFSMIGYASQNIAVNSRTVIDVTLHEDVTDIGVVTVEVPIGYGTQKAEHLTMAATVITPEQIQDLPLGNLAATLSGLSPGLRVDQAGFRKPGSNSTLIVRDPLTASKTGESTPTPIYVIDDIIQNAERFNELDPSEIESIVILKDGAAAIYGSRGSSGAILVKTKRGKAGAPRISYNGQYAWNDKTMTPKVMDAYDYGIWANRFNGEFGQNKALSDKKSFFQEDELEQMKNLNYDWLDKAWRTGSSYRHTLNISGGTETASYFGSATYYTQDGNLGSYDYDRWTFRAGIDVKVAKNLKVGMTITGNWQENDSPRNTSNFSNLLTRPKYIPWEVDGQWVAPVTGLGTNVGQNAKNPNFFQMDETGNRSENRSNNTQINLNATYEVPFVPGLSFKGTYNRSHSNNDNRSFNTNYTILRPTLLGGSGNHLYWDGDGTYPAAQYQEDRVTAYGNDSGFSYTKTMGVSEQMNFYANYNRSFKDHHLSAMGAIEKSKSDSHNNLTKRQTPMDETNWETGTATGTVSGSSGRSESGDLSYLGRLHYDYANKYLFDFVVRSDASTKFAPENYWGTFFSTSAAWVISQENFFRNRGSKLQWIDYAKLRFSFGKSGKDNTKAWQWRQMYSYKQYGGGIYGPEIDGLKTPGMEYSSIANPDSHWDTSWKWNGGIDLRFLRGRLSASFDYWYDQNRDMLKQPPNAFAGVTIGGQLAEMNFAEADAWGWDLSIGWSDKIGADFRYSVNVNSSWYWDKIRYFGPEDHNFTPWTKERKGTRISDVGAWGLDAIGIMRTKEDIDWYFNQYAKEGKLIYLGNTVTPDNSKWGYTYLKPGMLMYKDVRSAEFDSESGRLKEERDGRIDKDSDLVRFSRTEYNPYHINMNIALGWKGLEFTAQINSSWGGFKSIDYKAAIGSSPGVFYLDMFEPEGSEWANPNGKWANPGQSANTSALSNHWQIPSFELRVSRMTLAYSLPKRWVSKINVGAVRFNLAVVNAFSLYNPYPKNYLDSFSSASIDYPTLRTISLGLNLTL